MSLGRAIDKLDYEFRGAIPPDLDFHLDFRAMNVETCRRMERFLQRISSKRVLPSFDRAWNDDLAQSNFGPLSVVLQPYRAIDFYLERPGPGRLRADTKPYGARFEALGTITTWIVVHRIGGLKSAKEIFP